MDPWKMEPRTKTSGDPGLSLSAGLPSQAADTPAAPFVGSLSGDMWLWLKIKQDGQTERDLVHASTYRGSILAPVF